MERQFRVAVAHSSGLKAARPAELRGRASAKSVDTE